MKIHFTHHLSLAIIWFLKQYLANSDSNLLYLTYDMYYYSLKMAAYHQPATYKDISYND